MSNSHTVEMTTDQSVLEYFKNVRLQTREILEPLETEDYVIQTDFFMSPPRWHLGHVSWFYDQLLRQHDPGYKPYSKNYDHYLNSYYQTFGQPFDKGRRGTISRPTVAETMEYAEWIDKEVGRYLTKNNGGLTKEVETLFFLAFNHEYQHQELLVYDVQHLLQNKYQPHKRSPSPAVNGCPPGSVKNMIRIPGGIFELGFDPLLWPGIFCYDVEMPLHKIYLNDFEIDTAPVTNGDYLEFISDGGYEDFRHWLSDGWEQVHKNKWMAPLYWEKNQDGQWTKADFRGVFPIADIADEPVVHVSYYEAYAYAKWAGKRLPTEGEWEKAAAWNEDTGQKQLYPWGNGHADAQHTNLFESRVWNPAVIGSYPSGKSYYGCHQMVGDVWEWTASEFMPYPGFKSGFEEYNDKWFGNQKVLRGGSFATARDQARNTYRNFFRCDERWLFAGFRCARDV